MSFWGELKRRKVFQVATVYAVTAWLLVQVIVSVKTPLQLPEWSDTFVIVLLALGFPVTLILSWVFELTPEGIKPEHGAEAVGDARRPAGVIFTYVTQSLVLFAVGFLVIDEYVLGERGSSRPPPTDVIRYRHGLADGERLVPAFGVSIAVSPDGARIAYVGPADGGTQLWLRERDQLRSTPLPGSEGALEPFFAPDGRGVGFVTGGGELKVITRIGDPPLSLVGDVYPLGGDWAEDGYVYFSAPDRKSVV